MELFPPMPLASWQDTKQTLHRFCQVVGKLRLAASVRRNHWWNVPFHLTGRGITTRPMGQIDGNPIFCIDFDFIDHELHISILDGRAATVPLQGQSVASFHDQTLQALGRVSRIVLGLVGSGPEPDEDVRDGDGGLVAVGQLVKAGGHRPELLAAVHQPLHLIPGAVPVAVKGRRPPTTTTPVSPVGLLIVTLWDRVPDVAGAQRGPVGTAAVGLVAGQVIRAHPGPTPPTRPRHPHLVNQPDQLGGVGVLARSQPGRQVPTATIADGVELGGQPTP
jgi:hypothetical protein